MTDHFIVLAILYVCLLFLYAMELWQNKTGFRSRDTLIDAQHSLIKALYRSLNFYRLRAGEQPYNNEYDIFVQKHNDAE